MSSLPLPGNDVNFAAMAITFLSPFKNRVKRKARGMLRHDYLVPGGPYEEQWDWDAFFIGMALASEDAADAVYVKNWALNYIENSREDGFTPGLVTPDGPDKRLNQMKPFLAQGCFFASRFLNDTGWLAPQYDRLKTIVLYREQHGFFDTELGLGAWTNSMESGADNNVAALDFPDGAVGAVDFNCFLWMEYAAMERLAKLLGRNDDESFFTAKAAALKTAILTHLWCEEDGTFYNIDFRDRSFIRVVGYSSLHPFWAGIASKEQSDRFFPRYVFNTEEMMSPYGIRTLSKKDSRYNNVNMIKPHSNWQGPLWPIATYIGVQAMMNYGYQSEARSVAERIIWLCIEDIKTSGGMHENYDAETGLPLAAPDFVSWNLLLLQILPQIESQENPFAMS
jgi:alpha,alpha-trehalase